MSKITQRNSSSAWQLRDKTSGEKIGQVECCSACPYISFHPGLTVRGIREFWNLPSLEVQRKQGMFEDRFLFPGKWRSRTESSAIYWPSRAEMAQLASGTCNSPVWSTFPAFATQFLTHRGIVQLEEMPRSEALHLWRNPQRGSSFGVISTSSAGPLVAHRRVGSSQALLCDRTQNVLSEKSQL